MKKMVMLMFAVVPAMPLAGITGCQQKPAKKFSDY